jgi:hypothetical protein
MRLRVALVAVRDVRGSGAEWRCQPLQVPALHQRSQPVV